MAPAVEKPSELVDENAELVVEEGEEFVSRGGIKLKNALGELRVEVEGRRCLDVGASTGGFTDCLLQRGARAGDRGGRRLRPARLAACARTPGSW